MRCYNCNSKCKKMNKYNYDDPTIGTVQLDLNYYICCNCHKIQSFSINKMNEIYHKCLLKRKDILIQKYKRSEDWITLHELKNRLNNFNKNKLFYIIDNKKYLFLKKSIDNYERYNDGLFWIGDESIFKLNNKYDFLKTINIHILDNYVIEIAYSDGTWRQFDTKNFLKFNSKNEFINMNHYGYGGLIWNNGNAIDHLTILNNSINYKTNKEFDDILKIEIK